MAIHTILYVRQIYPADLFVRRKKYNMPVFQSRHPALNDYISGAVNAIGDELAQVNGSFVPNIVLHLKPPRTRHRAGYRRESGHGDQGHERRRARAFHFCGAEHDRG